MIKLNTKLNEGQLDKLADFSVNIGVVQFAIVVTPIFSNTGNSNPFMIVLGIILMFGFLSISLSLKR